MTVLTPMREDVFAGYVESSVIGYAQENIAAGRWPVEGAIERSAAEFRDLLPLGLATPKNHLFEIKAGDNGTTVGFIWFAEEDRHGARGAYVYDIVVKEDFRRQGHAQRAFLALEPLVAELGLSSIGLHVFGHNAGAQALYAKLGYAVTGINMLKKLNAPTQPFARGDRSVRHR
jgi:ribosomal protein S18 acetylase RimI-like enzyme